MPGGKPPGDSASQHPGYPPRLLALAEGPLNPPPWAWGPSRPHLLAPGRRRPRLLISWTVNRGLRLPAPKAGLLRVLWLQSGLWLARDPLGCAPPGGVAGAGGAGRRGEPPSRSPLHVSQLRDPRPGGRREMLVPPRCPLHASIPLPFMRPSVHSYLSHSVNISASAFRAHLLSAGGRCGVSFRESQCKGDPSCTPPRCHLAEEEDGTGGSQG